MNKEIRVEARLRNNRLYHSIFDSYPSVAAFCEVSGFHQGVVGSLLNLKKWPYKKRGKQKGDYLKVCVELAEFFHCLPEYLFPAQLYSLDEVTAEKEYSFSELPCLVRAQLLPEAKNPEEILLEKDLSATIGQALSRLAPREEVVLRKRFGLIDGDEKTLEEIGNEFGVSGESIRQIEQKALRKLRHPGRIKNLR